MERSSALLTFVSNLDPGPPCAYLTKRILVQSVHENRIYSVNIHCGPDYPDNPPTIQFVSAVNIPCVDQRTGKVGVESPKAWRNQD